mgnify:CR=1 FL=1
MKTTAVKQTTVETTEPVKQTTVEKTEPVESNNLAEQTKPVETNNVVEMPDLGPRRSVAFIGSECYPFVKNWWIGRCNVSASKGSGKIKYGCESHHSKI